MVEIRRFFNALSKKASQNQLHIAYLLDHLIYFTGIEIKLNLILSIHTCNTFQFYIFVLWSNLLSASKK